MAARNVNSYAVFHNENGRVSITFKYEGGGVDMVHNLEHAESKYLVDLMRNEKPIAYDHARRRIWTSSYEQVGQGEGGVLAPHFNLENWLNQRPSFRTAINWEFPNGQVRNYSQWTSAQKRELADAYKRVLGNRDLVLDEAPDLAVVAQGDDRAVSVFTEAVAWKYYIGHVAHSLVVEADKRVNWSMRHLEDEEIKVMLDGRSYYTQRNNNTYEIVRGTVGGVTYGNPSRLYRFLIDNNLIGSNHSTTIARVIRWCRGMVHYTGRTQSDNVFAQWQYRGLPPIERVIHGTPHNDRPQEVKHRTGGCWGTTGFLRALLRVINIPVELVRAGGHAVPHFMSVDKYLSHGDDPYNGFFRESFEIPDRELLISEATYQEWFVNAPTPVNNVGRRVKELAVQYLPVYLLNLHCADLRRGLDHANSHVASTFERVYSLQELENQRLWERMDAKIAQLGGCAALD